MTAPAQQTTLAARPSALWRFGFGTALALAMAAAPFVVAATSVLAPLIIEDLGLRRVQIGLLTSVVYIVSALAAPHLGSVVDRFGGRRTMIALFAGAGVAMIGLAVAPNYPMLVVAAALIGVPMGLANPVTNHLVQARIEPGSRGLLMGVKQSGVKMGQSAASAVLPALALALGGWRQTFAATVPVMAVGLVLGALVLRGEQSTPPSRRQATPSRAAHPLVTTLAVFGFLMGTGQAAMGAYLTLYAFEELAFSVTAAGAVTAVLGFIAVLARILWGRLAERLTSVAAPLTGVAIGAALAVVLVMAAEVVGAGVIWVGVVLFGITAPVWLVIGMLAVLRTVEPAATGRSSGLVFRGFSIGFIVGPLAFGYSVDRLGSYLPGWAGIGIMFLVAAVVAQRFRRHDGPQTAHGT